MALSHFSMLIHDFLDKDPYIVPKEDTIIILDSTSAVCMVKNGKDTKNTTYIAIRVSFARNGDEWKMHKIYWCEGGLQLPDIATKHVGENDINPRMKYITIRLENW